MPSKRPLIPLQKVVDAVGVYPISAFLFVQNGLSYTVEKIHGQFAEPTPSHHISGQDLCLGLRDYALEEWGLLARIVLERWNINTTMDFGRIVFAMIEFDHMQKTEKDQLNDFRQVYDFQSAFESSYRISAMDALEEAGRPHRAGSKA